MFVKVDGIPGESQDTLHRDWIEVLAVGDSILAPLTSPPPTVPYKANFGPFKILKHIDRTSPKFRLTAAEGDHIKTIIIDCLRLENDAWVRFLYVRLSDVTIAEVSITPGVALSGFGGAEYPRELVAFSYRKIEFTYYYYRTPGGTPLQVNFSWDVPLNRRP
jgi:type VI secretion system secreted protein Hcp